MGRARRPQRAECDPYRGEADDRRRETRRGQHRKGSRSARSGSMSAAASSSAPTAASGATRWWVASLRRPDLASDRGRGGAADDPPRGPARTGGRLLPELARRECSLPRPGRALVIPGPAAGHRAGRGACRGRTQDRADRDLRRLDPDPNPDHRGRLGSLRRAADPGRGHGPRRAGVRRGSDRPGGEGRYG